mmetsp:Transcript_15229/g.34991  ORF Transcript_15229/g.34991 Transcript_15229/m.34991 type:complete len:271 (+) Transcript_15229:298-1110(+)
MRGAESSSSVPAPPPVSKATAMSPFARMDASTIRPGAGDVVDGQTRRDPRYLLGAIILMAPASAVVKTTKRDSSWIHSRSSGEPSVSISSSYTATSVSRWSCSSYTTTCFCSRLAVGAAMAARYLPDGAKESAKKWSPSGSALPRSPEASFRTEGALLRDPGLGADFLGSLSFIAVEPHSAPSKPWLTLMVEVEARASAGEKSDASHAPAVMPCLCRPAFCETEMAAETESHTAKLPSARPRASWPALLHRAQRGSKLLFSLEKESRLLR